MQRIYVFGCGAHACLGRLFAMNHITSFAAITSMIMEWHHTQPGVQRARTSSIFQPFTMTV